MKIVEILTGIFLFLFAGVSASAAFLHPEHLSKNTRKYISGGLLILTVCYCVFLGFTYLNPKALKAADDLSLTPTPNISSSKPVSVWLRDNDLEILFAASDTPKPHLYITFHVEVFNSTDETRLFKSEILLLDTKYSPNWNLVQETCQEVGENTSLNKFELKIAPKSPVVLNVTLLFETGDQSKPGFYDELKFLNRKRRVKISIFTDHGEYATTTKIFNVGEQLISNFRTTLPNYASQWVTTH